MKQFFILFCVLIKNTVYIKNLPFIILSFLNLVSSHLTKDFENINEVWDIPATVRRPTSGSNNIIWLRNLPSQFIENQY